MQRFPVNNTEMRPDIKWLVAPHLYFCYRLRQPKLKIPSDQYTCSFIKNMQQPAQCTIRKKSTSTILTLKKVLKNNASIYRQTTRKL